MVVGVLQWLKRVDDDDGGSELAGGRLNSTITFRHDGHVYALLSASRGGSRTSVTTSRRRGGDDTGVAAAVIYVSQLTVSPVTPHDAGLYVCVVTGRYGVRSDRAAALRVHPSTGQPLSRRSFAPLPYALRCIAGPRGTAQHRIPCE